MKHWQKPVLVVLTACKSPDPAGVGAAAYNGTPTDSYGACMYQLSANSIPSCGTCQATDAS